MNTSFISRSITRDGYHVVAWSNGAIGPSRLVANYRGMGASARRHHEADAMAAAAIIDAAPCLDRADIIAALPEIRGLWRNHAAGGDLPGVHDVLRICGQHRAHRLAAGVP